MLVGCPDGTAVAIPCQTEEIGSFTTENEDKKLEAEIKKGNGHKTANAEAFKNVPVKTKVDVGKGKK